jgi:hypothetical protein
MTQHEFHLNVIGRYPARLKGNEPAVTVNLLVGGTGHLVYSGTLTLTEAEWEDLVEGLRAGLGERLVVQDRASR